MASPSAQARLGSVQQAMQRKKPGREASGRKPAQAPQTKPAVGNAKPLPSGLGGALQGSQNSRGARANPAETMAQLGSRLPQGAGQKLPPMDSGSMPKLPPMLQQAVDGGMDPEMAMKRAMQNRPGFRERALAMQGGQPPQTLPGFPPPNTSLGPIGTAGPSAPMPPGAEAPPMGGGMQSSPMPMMLTPEMRARQEAGNDTFQAAARQLHGPNGPGGMQSQTEILRGPQGGGQPFQPGYGPQAPSQMGPGAVQNAKPMGPGGPMGAQMPPGLGGQMPQGGMGQQGQAPQFNGAPPGLSGQFPAGPGGVSNAKPMPGGPGGLPPGFAPPGMDPAAMQQLMQMRGGMGMQGQGQGGGMQPGLDRMFMY